MRPSHLSYSFLGSFLIAIFTLKWWQAPAYPLSLWLVLGLFGILGILGAFTTAGRRPALVLLMMIFGISMSLWTVSRTTHVPSPQAVDYYAGEGRVTIRGVIR